MRPVSARLLAVLALAGSALAGCARAVEPTESPSVAPAVAPDQATVDMGRELFAGRGNCFACHGTDASGTALAPPLDDDVWLNVVRPTHAEVARVIEEGVAIPKEHPTPMPPMGAAALSRTEIDALAAYVLSLSGSAP